MCGLFLSIDVAASQDAISVVSHRGPDALAWEKISLNSHTLLLGHARLKILDLSEAANQPFYDDDKDNALLFNGAIYNYIELREELETLGFKFKTRSDTEVLLCALKQWGVGALSRLSGMFAFIWVNKSENKVLAARDRFGIKPLYFMKTDRGIAFGSEIKQLLSLNLQPRVLNLEAAFDFLESGITDHLPETFFSGIMPVRGGQFIELQLQDNAPIEPVEVKTWWKPAQKSNYRSKSLNEEAHNFREKFQRSLKLHLRADVPVGACLSGGLDSSAIVSGINQILEGDHQRLQTFTAEFIGDRVDESRFARAVGDACDNTDYNSVRPKAENLKNVIPIILHHQDEPFGSSSLYAQWSVFKAAQDAGMVVMLDGQGADELMAGYHPGYIYYFIKLLRSGRWVKLHRDLKAYGSAQNIDTRPVLREVLIKSFQASAFLNPLLNLWRRMRGKAKSPIQHWLDGNAFASLFKSGRDDILKACAQREELSKPLDLDALCRLMVTSISLPSLLRFEDRNAMAHSLESRVPFLDPDFAQLCLDLGNDYKINGHETKQILRRSVGDWLPKLVKDRRDKIGFATPEETWFSGPLKTEIVEGAMQCVKTFPDMFNRELTEAWIQDVSEKKLPYNTRLWRIFILGRWMQQFNVSLVSALEAK